MFEAFVLVKVCILESNRKHFGQTGSFKDQFLKHKLKLSGNQVRLSVILTIPVFFAFIYLVIFQTLVLEDILCALLVLLQAIKFTCAAIYLFKKFKTPTYECKKFLVERHSFSSLRSRQTKISGNLQFQAV